jgi:hypothetical protein
MAGHKPDSREPTQKTPKGIEIPVPKREDVMRDLEKVAKPNREKHNEQSSGSK